MIVGCIGDSNTRFGTPPSGFDQPGPGTIDKWADYCATEPGGDAHTWRNFAVGGSGVCGWGPGFESFLQGPQQLRHALLSGCNAIIASFGTNDFRVAGKSRDEIVQAYCALLAMAKPTPVIVALTPDCTDTVGATAAFIALNARLMALGRGGWKLLDFWTDSTAAIDTAFPPGGVHFTDAHEHVRAQRAVAAVNAL